MCDGERCGDMFCACLFLRFLFCYLLDYFSSGLLGQHGKVEELEKGRENVVDLMKRCMYVSWKIFIR